MDAPALNKVEHNVFETHPAGRMICFRVLNSTNQFPAYATNAVELEPQVEFVVGTHFDCALVTKPNTWFAREKSESEIEWHGRSIERE